MKFDCIVVGGGIVGLATAYQLLAHKASLKILLIEKESQLSSHQTGNNSGVIHSGIYYKPGSKKAVNCTSGYRYLVEFSKERGVRHEICGKIIVAKNETELPILQELFRRGEANGLTGLKMLKKEEILEYEPNVTGIAGIHVPQTGIIDYKEVSESFASAIRERGGEILLSTRLLGIRRLQDHTVVIETSARAFETKMLLTCGGLQSDRIAKMTSPSLPLRIIPFRGEYYKIKEEKKHLVRNLIYPVPDPNFPFLGVHFTRMIDGTVEAGPNAVFAFKREGYERLSFSLRDTKDAFAWEGFRKVVKKYWRTGLGEYYRSFNKSAFTKALQELVPAIESDDLVPGGAGVRAQACDKEGGLLDDFFFAEEPNIVHVCNAPSPAATASLSIGKTLAEKALNQMR